MKFSKILKTPPENRSKFQIEKLTNTLNKGIYFTQLKNEGKEDVTYDCAKVLKLEKFK